MSGKTKCPQCGETLITVNTNGTKEGLDTYCEECGWPDDNLEPNPPCVICGNPGVGICGEQWRCEDHWVNDP